MKRIALMSCSMVFVMLFSAGISLAAWEIVFEHSAATMDSAGTILSEGVPLNNTNINDLKAAVLNGSDIKVRLNGPITQHSITLNKVRVATRADGSILILGYNDLPAPTPGVLNATTGIYTNYSGVAPRMQTFSTTGTNFQYYPKNSSHTNNIVYAPVSLTWFVNR